MHSFTELSNRCTEFTLTALKDVEYKTIKELGTSGATAKVKTLQMVRLNKVIFAVGIFSIFEAVLQDQLNCKKGFDEAEIILKQAGEITILQKFIDIKFAVNVLKHGHGQSYNALIIKNGGTLISQIKQPTENIFNEGDVSEVTTLIDVDDKFIEGCVKIIEKVSKVIQNNRPGVFL